MSRGIMSGPRVEGGEKKEKAEHKDNAKRV